MRNVYFVTWPNGYFGSAAERGASLSIDQISQKLSNNGFNVIEVKIDNLLEYKLDKNDFVVYTSSDEANIRKYIQDVMYFVKEKACLVPNYDILMAHENKGFQELFRYENNFGSLPGKYHFDRNKLPDKYPYVFKTVSGSGSSGVELVRNESDRNKINNKYFKKTFKRKVVNFIRSKQLSAEKNEIYAYRHQGFFRYIQQNFIPDLTCDYRVLIFHEKYYVMRRDVRKNDFRASGSKSFSYTDAPIEVLNFARLVYEKLDTPYASLDIAYDKNKECSLIEYQGMNFGSSALRNSNGYHQWKSKESNWVYIAKKSYLDEEFDYAIYFHIKNKLHNKE